jgi:DNA (cytosine-5)-methyltransferase 1
VKQEDRPAREGIPSPSGPRGSQGELALLKTPTAQLAVNGGSQHPDKRRAGGHGPTLADQVEHEVALLPTPVSTLGSNADAISQAKGREGGTLVEALSLLPTPVVADSRNTETALTGRPGEAGGLHEVSWGEYEAAIRRWEYILGREAPCPIEPGKNGNRRLHPEFASWMMGLPPGWVTGVPGLSRSAMLKLVGNGVVPQQGALAIQALLDAVDWLPLRILAARRMFTNDPEPEKEEVA